MAAALYLFTSVARASHAVARERISAIVRFCFERCMAVRRLGMAMAARMPMMAKTIRSSMRVKPFSLRIICSPFVGCNHSYYNGRTISLSHNDRYKSITYETHRQESDTFSQPFMTSDVNEGPRSAWTLEERAPPALRR